MGQKSSKTTTEQLRLKTDPSYISTSIPCHVKIFNFQTFRQTNLSTIQHHKYFKKVSSITDTLLHQRRKLKIAKLIYHISNVLYLNSFQDKTLRYICGSSTLGKRLTIKVKLLMNVHITNGYSRQIQKVLARVWRVSLGFIQFYNKTRFMEILNRVPNAQTIILDDVAGSNSAIKMGIQAKLNTISHKYKSLEGCDSKLEFLHLLFYDSVYVSKIAKIMKDVKLLERCPQLKISLKSCQRTTEIKQTNLKQLEEYERHFSARIFHLDLKEVEEKDYDYFFTNDVVYSVLEILVLGKLFHVQNVSFNEKLPKLKSLDAFKLPQSSSEPSNSLRELSLSSSENRTIPRGFFKTLRKYKAIVLDRAQLQLLDPQIIREISLDVGYSSSLGPAAILKEGLPPFRSCDFSFTSSQVSLLQSRFQAGFITELYIRYPLPEPMHQSYFSFTEKIPKKITTFNVYDHGSKTNHLSDLRILATLDLNHRLVKLKMENIDIPKEESMLEVFNIVNRQAFPSLQDLELQIFSIQSFDGSSTRLQTFFSLRSLIVANYNTFLTVLKRAMLYYKDIHYIDLRYTADFDN